MVVTNDVKKILMLGVVMEEGDAAYSLHFVLLEANLYSSYYIVFL